MRFRLLILVCVTALAAISTWVTFHAKPKPDPVAEAELMRIFAAAKDSYLHGRYPDCLMKLETLHQKNPSFENSQELEQFCRQGLDLMPRIPSPEEVAQQKRAIEAEIEDVVRECKKMLGPHPTLRKTQDCLAPAIELNPEDERVVGMLRKAKSNRK